MTLFPVVFPFSFAQDTDQKLIEEQLQPNSASGSGSLEHDATAIYKRYDNDVPSPLPIGQRINFQFQQKNHIISRFHLSNWDSLTVRSIFVFQFDWLFDLNKYLLNVYPIDWIIIHYFPLVQVWTE